MFYIQNFNEFIWIQRCPLKYVPLNFYIEKEKKEKRFKKIFSVIDYRKIEQLKRGDIIKAK